MAETNLAFAKIVATPTPTAWSQAYSAGRLFAAFSLQSETIPQAGEEHLASIGKDLISTLESEFFTLENKDLDSIKQAILTTIARVGSGINISLVVCFLTDNVLYLYAIGGGKAVLKRAEKIGTVLEGEDNINIKSASGYVQEGDVIILQTKSFLKIIPSSTLASAIDGNSPDEIAENLAPHVHEKDEGGASAVILLYKEGELQDIPALSDDVPENTAQSPLESEPKEEETPKGVIESQESNIETPPTLDVPAPIPDLEVNEDLELESTPPTPNQGEDLSESQSPFLKDQFPKKRRLSFGLKLGALRRPAFSGQRRIIGIVAIVLIILIAITSILALNSRKSSQNQKLFASVYSQAKSKFEEGQNLKDLNAGLAQKSFSDAKTLLDANKDKFSANSKEGKQILSLLDQVNSEVSKTPAEGEKTTANEVKSTSSPLLGYELNNPSAAYFVENDSSAYFLDGTGVSKIDKGNDKKSQVIKKTWKTDGGIGLFGSNVYVLDRADGILKFVAAEDSFTKTDYFADTSPDFSSSAAMAIDGSIFVLFKDGHIDKYTKAKKDEFTISGLAKPLSSPTKIFTNDGTDNLYILDNGNSRVVVLDKTGKFKNAFSASVIKNAKDFDVDEKDKKIFILSSGKVYQTDIK